MSNNKESNDDHNTAMSDAAYNLITRKAQSRQLPTQVPKSVSGMRVHTEYFDNKESMAGETLRDLLADSNKHALGFK